MKEYLENSFDKLASKLPYLKEIELTFSVPNIASHGDLALNAAMLLAKKLKRNPREIAQEIVDNFEVDKNIIDKIEIAGPGFINFLFKPEFLANIINRINEEDESFGKSDRFKGKKALVEFVSANPTGPLTVGHGRNAVIGDTVANLLEWAGYDVEREYYFNNAGRQMRVLGDSLRLRYLQLKGEDIDFPEDYYQGQYLIDIAKKLYAENKSVDTGQSSIEFFKDFAEKEIFTEIQNTLKGIGIRFDNYFNEHTLYEDKKIDDVLNRLKESNLSYEKDNAIWFRLSELEQENDKVIVKSTGEPTYRLPDIAYHLTKFERGYDIIVDLFGSDHAATYPDVLAGVKALGYDEQKVKVLIHQFVTVLENGEVVKMSTRKANFITLDELIEKVGSDVVRYFFIMRNISSHLNFDIDLARKQSDENPVFYLQYAHARICSILRMTEEEGLKSSFQNLELLTHPSEQNLIKKMHQFKDELNVAIDQYEPQRLANYLEELAAAFHKFYTDCRIIGSGKELAEARIALVKAVKIVIKNGLTILGLTAPERM
ncbi:MAG: arginine--tRNA ligase [Melioribacteraceae bacterium]|nr:arginine--tRNA ligase [Melioribacteraceae bacterium]MCF8353095.1 arginine--tRNA ligase [Melioribacteraceae bacterium]MCF8392759.1 arginine--tRNA ligase [Melioribacteraceae bacterium]MCF8418290.1 arginine--tRNA ligase [Melioribacteraceae bacterium]